MKEDTSEKDKLKELLKENLSVEIEEKNVYRGCGVGPLYVTQKMVVIYFDGEKICSTCTFE